jgi:hypothetical protein
VAVTGTTVIFEGSRGGRNKLYTLEGSSRVALKKKPGDWRKVMAGQFLDVPPGAATLPMPVNFDVNQLMRTHPLITDFRPLPSYPLIMAVAQQPAPPPPPPPSYTGPAININLPGGFNVGPRGPRGPYPNPTVTPRPNRHPPGTTPPGTTNPPTTNNNPPQTPTPGPILRTGPKPTNSPSPSRTPSRNLKKKSTTQSGPG